MQTPTADPWWATLIVSVVTALVSLVVYITHKFVDHLATSNKVNLEQASAFLKEQATYRETQAQERAEFITSLRQVTSELSALRAIESNEQLVNAAHQAKIEGVLEEVRNYARRPSA
jgi:uncharacterized protein (UPF0305 family)